MVSRRRLISRDDYGEDNKLFVSKSSTYLSFLEIVFYLTRNFLICNFQSNYSTPHQQQKMLMRQKKSGEMENNNNFTCSGLL